MRVLIINLDRSPERLAMTVSELEKWGLSGERVPAIDGRTLPGHNIEGFKPRGKGNETLYRGSAGCFFSHCRALEIAIEGDIWPCMIVEDDVVITEMPTVFEDDKPIVYFGGLDVSGRGVYGGHAICYRTREAAEIVLAFAREHPENIDTRLVRLQKRKDIFSFRRPYPITQAAGFSLIIERYRKAR